MAKSSINFQKASAHWACPPKLKIKVRALARFTELLVGRSFFARFLRQKWRLALYKFVLKSLLYYRSASKHDIDIVSGVIIEYFTSVNRIFYEFNRIFYEFLLE